MISYIADSRNIVFQRTKNILLQDIISITPFMLLVNILLRELDNVRTKIMESGEVYIPDLAPVELL